MFDRDFGLILAAIYAAMTARHQSAVFFGIR
jgi:hypothetical protein